MKFEIFTPLGFTQDLRNQPRISVIATVGKQSQNLDFRGECVSPITVRTSEEYWQRLIIKHPDIEELEELVRLALATPDEVRRSSRDAEVLLFYRVRGEERWVVAVARRLNGNGFLITAYQTDAIKEGETVWLK